MVNLSPAVTHLYMLSPRLRTLQSRGGSPYKLQQQRDIQLWGDGENGVGGHILLGLPYNSRSRGGQHN